jgi:hypothetical protein
MVLHERAPKSDDCFADPHAERARLGNQDCGRAGLNNDLRIRLTCASFEAARGRISRRQTESSNLERGRDD